jgi:hypothetical protein
MGKRIVYILAVPVFIVASLIVLIASAGYWIFTGKNLLFVIDWMIKIMDNIV